MTTDNSAMAPGKGRSANVRTLSFMLNLLGVIAGAATALASIAAWASPIGFFSGVAAAFYCLDPVRQSW